MKQKDLDAFAERERVDIAWLIEFMNEEDIEFQFLFQRSVEPWIWEFKELEEDDITEGLNAIHKAKLAYIAGVKKYGLLAPQMGDGHVTKISSRHIPRRYYDYE